MFASQRPGSGFTRRCRFLIFAVIALALGLACLPAIAPDTRTEGSAFASASVPSTIEFSHGHTVWYGGTGSGSHQGRDTHTYHCKHDGVSEVAYCALPNKNWIDTGEHPTTPLVGGSARVKDAYDVAMVLYYGYGGPGFDKSMWPSKYYDGTPMDQEDRYEWSAWYDKYYALTHLLVTDRAYGDDDDTTYLCSDAYTKWFAWNIQGNKHWATKYADKDDANPNSVYNKMKAAWSQLSETFRAEYANSCYAINPHAWGDTEAQIFLVAAKSKPPIGSISLVKSSANASLTAGNACYSLAGARYGVFDTEQKAASHDAGAALKTFTTGEDGSWRSDDEFEAGAYFVSETNPSAGYRLDENVYAVKVVAGKNTQVNGASSVYEMPVDAPIDLLTVKRDRDLGRSTPQGAATLAEAEFTVRFYAGYHDASNLPSSAARTWVLKTKENGSISFQDAARLKVSGDDFYRNADGLVTFPLGTVSITETRAPRGYNLESADSGKPKTYVFQVVQDPSSPSGASARPINYPYASGTGAAPVVDDDVKRGDYRLIKEVPIEIREDAPQEQRRVLVEGVRFQFVNENDNVVVSPQTGEEVPKGSVVCEMVTNADGFASTRAAIDVNGWSLPEGWSGALAYGTYSVHELVPDEVQNAFQEKYGTSLLTVPDWRITISDEGQYDPATLVNDKIPQTPLSIEKVDAETGVHIPLPVSFQLFDSAGNLVTYTSHYPEESTIDTWTANERGELTLPMLLPGGSYTLRETLAPEGYVLLSEDIEFTVDDYRGWDDPLTVTVADNPIKGVIEIVKADADTGDAVAGAQYIVVAAADIVTPDGTVRKQEGETVAVVVTDADGIARTPELYLGSYKVYEAKAPEGFALDTEEHVVALASEGQDVPVVTVHAQVVDAPTKLRVKKVDAHTGQALPGAVFKMSRVGEDGSVELTTGEDGIAELSYLAHGTYRLSELVAPQGHHLADGGYEVEFVVDDQGFAGIAGEGFSDTLSLVVENAANEIGTLAAVDGDQMASAVPGVTLVDKVAYAGCVPGKTYTVTGTLHRAMRSEDGAVVDGGVLLGADGNPIQSQTEFVPEASQGTVDVAFAFDATSFAGFKVVVFEEMYCEGVLFAEHADITDDDQTVFFKPDASTVLVDKETGNHTGRVASAAVLVDTVSYRGLTVGHTYRVRGVLMDKEAHVPVADASGVTVMAETEFTPTSPDGDVSLEFPIDSSSLAGRSVVAFEKVLEGEEEVIVHEDYADEAQTVAFPTAKTSAADGDDGDSFVLPDGKARVVDTVVYTGLAPGQEYVVEGTLHKVSQSSNGALKDAGAVKKPSGKKVTAQATFTPDKPDGKVKVTFNFNASKLGNERLVVFEVVKQTGVIGQSGKKRKAVTVVKHADVNDEAQTVTMRAPTAGESLVTRVSGLLPKTQDEVRLAVAIAFCVLAVLAGTVICIARRRRQAHPRHAR